MAAWQTITLIITNMMTNIKLELASDTVEPRQEQRCRGGRAVRHKTCMEQWEGNV